MYRIAVCEDDPRTAEQNKTAACHVLEGKGRSQGRDYDVEVFHTAAPLMKRLTADPDAYQLLLLDIQLDGDNGVELARFLREHKVSASIIYITDPPGFALDSFPTYPLEYLLKPVDMNALRSCLLKAAAQSDPKEASPVTPMTMEELDGSGIKNPYAKEMLRYIQEHYSERISLTELSQQLNISCTHLNAKFKAETGHTFHDFLNYYRISKAVEFQQEGDKKLYEIAEMVGFSDYKYFSKVYKKYVGYPPNKLFTEEKSE